MREKREELLLKVKDLRLELFLIILIFLVKICGVICGVKEYLWGMD